MAKDDKPRPLLIKEVITEPDKRLLITRSERRSSPAVGILDDPVRCYRANVQWAAHIAGAVSTLTEVQAWVGADDETHNAIQSILQFLQGTVCDMIDCAEVEDCIETSDTITAIFGVTYNVQLANTQDHFDVLIALYDGTAQSIGASIPLTAADLNSLHDNALCSVLTSLIRVYAGSKGIELVLMSDFGRWYQDLLAGMRTIAGIVPDYFWHLLGDELHGCAADVATATAALGDAQAIEDLACCLRDELRAAGMSQAVYDAALVTCAGSLSGNAGILACLFDGDNSLSHYLSFLEAYNTVLERQVAGDDFTCFCVPDGWFWVDVDFDWSVGVHGGTATSPVFSHTNPFNGRLFSVTYVFRSNGPDANGITIADTGLPDALMIGTASRRPAGMWLWEDSVVGWMEGADAVGWPVAQRRDAGMEGVPRLPDETFSIQWGHQVNLGGTADAQISHVRLLYKVVP